MPGIDKLFAGTISFKLKERLGKSNFKILERQIFVRYGLSVKLAIENFPLINRQIYLSQIKNPNFKHVFKEVFLIRELPNKDYEITIVDKQLKEKFLKTIQDQENFILLRSVLTNVKKVGVLINETKIPKTTAYRKIQQLVENGYLIIHSKEKTSTKFSMKLLCIFSKMILEINDKKLDIRIIIPKKIYNKSTIKEFI